MCRPSNIDGRCEIRLLYLLKILILSLYANYAEGLHFSAFIIYIEDMRTKKALSAWNPLVSVFCSSGAVNGIRGKQMTSAVASERSIFSKNHDYNSYIKSFPCRGEHVRSYISGYRCTRGQKTTNRHTHTCGTATVTITIKIIRSAEAQWVLIIQRIRTQNRST